MSEDWSPGPDHVSLTVGELHVWSAELDGPSPGLDGLPASERRRAAAFLRDDAARLWIASRWALRRVLSRYLDEPAAEIALELAANDKPQLVDPAELHQLDHPADSQVDAVRNCFSGLRFNLSHSGDLALVALARDREVGVDVEQIEPARDLLALAERALAPDAVAEIRTADPAERPLAFYRAWTRHEARLKCLGIGLGGTDPGGQVTLADLEIGQGHAAAVAIADPELGTLHSWTLP